MVWYTTHDASKLMVGEHFFGIGLNASTKTFSPTQVVCEAMEMVGLILFSVRRVQFEMFIIANQLMAERGGVPTFSPSPLCDIMTPCTTNTSFVLLPFGHGFFKIYT